MYTCKYQYNYNFFNKPSPELSYFLGFYIADGYMSKNLRCITISVAEKDEEILKFFIKNLCPELKISSVLSKKFNSIQKRFSISCSKIVHKMYFDFKIPQQKTGNEMIPDIAKPFIYDFIRGYFDGDGTVGKTNKSVYMSICSPSEVFLNEIKDYLGGDRVYKTGNIYNLYIGVDTCFKNRDKLFNGSCFYLKRKGNLILDAKQSKYKVKNEVIEYILQNRNLGINTLMEKLGKTRRQIEYVLYYRENI